MQERLIDRNPEMETEGMHLARLCLKKVPGLSAVIAGCLHYSKTKQNKREKKKKKLSLTLRYHKRKINCSSLVGKFTEFSPQPWTEHSK